MGLFTKVTAFKCAGLYEALQFGDQMPGLERWLRRSH